MTTLHDFEQAQIAALTKNKVIPDFKPGDTVRVAVKVIEGERERTQVFEGVVIGRKNAGLNSNFTVRKISFGEGVERVFPLYSPRVDAIEVVRRGRVRRAKLYYLRGRAGKSARIAEQGGVQVPETGVAESPADAPVAPPAEPAGEKKAG